MAFARRILPPDNPAGGIHLAFLRKAAPMFKSRIAAAALIAATVAGCDKATPPISEARPVRTVTIQHGAEGEIVSLTGQVRAKDEVGPRLSPRRTDDRAARPCGRRLAAGQVVARLDPQIQKNALRSAEANLASMEAVLTQARLTFARQQELLEGRVDHPRQFRRGPAEAPDRPGPSQLCGGAVADRARAAELHGSVSRRRWSGHRRRRGAGRGGSRRADGCAACA